MTNTFKNIGIFFIGGIVGFLLAVIFRPQAEILSEETKVTVERIETEFSASKTGGAAVSKEKVKEKLSNVLTHPLIPSQEGTIESAIEQYPDVIYMSDIDTTFIAVDDSGFVTDSIQISSVFYSPTPIDKSSLHLLLINHTSYNKKVETTKIVEYKKGFFERFEVSPSITAGYGLLNKQFEVVVGAGIRYDFDFTNIF